MTDEQKDLRIVKTKKAIEQALFEIIEKNSFEAVTVKKLTKQAKINRGTFYLHYENIEHLVDEYYDDFTEKIYVLFEQKRKKMRNPEEKNGFVSPLLISLLELIKKNRKLFTLLWLTRENRFYQVKLKHFIRKILYTHKNAPINKKNLPVPEPYYTSYVFASFMGIVAEWVNRKCEESPEEIAKILATLNLNGIQ